MSESNSMLKLDIREIMEAIPHRYPFLLVDRVIELDMEARRLVAIKNVTMNEPYFMGHYPGMPVMPGVLQIEAMAQAAAIFMLLQPTNRGKTPLFTGIDAVKFRRQVGPGDQLKIVIEVGRMKPRVAKCETKCFVDDQLACEAQLTCMLAETPEE